MATSVFSNLYFSIVVLAIIAFADVLVKFRNARDLKFFFLLIPASIIFIALINSFNAIKFVYFIAFFKSCLGISILNIFSILYFPKFKKWTLFFSLIMLTVVLFLTLVNNNFFPPNRFLNQFIYISIDSKLNIEITPAVRLIRLSFLFVVVSHLIYFWYVIFSRVNLNNLYFAKIKTWTTLLFILSVIVIIANIIISFTSDRTFWTNWLTVFINFYILILVLKRPSFLNNSAKKIAFGHKFNLEQEAEIDELTFLKIFQEQKYFTNKEATLDGLANQLKVSTTQLSHFITKKYDMSFSDLLNKNRVNYFFEIVQNPAYHNYTIDALAREVGFSSRQHLNKPFKKFHGGNPSDLVEASISPE
jgi:AraC-like DNA-binding protein